MTVAGQHCCEMMTTNVEYRCSQHDQFECADNLVIWREQTNVYGLIVHDGGSSSVAIAYCPWCGVELGDSKRFLDGTLAEQASTSGTPGRTIEVD